MISIILDIGTAISMPNIPNNSPKKAIENNTILIDLNVSVPSKTEAKAICNKWENNSSDIYNKIIHALIED